jgi:hypothetical protein
MRRRRATHPRKHGRVTICGCVDQLISKSLSIMLQPAAYLQAGDD